MDEQALHYLQAITYLPLQLFRTPHRLRRFVSVFLLRTVLPAAAQFAAKSVHELPEAARSQAPEKLLPFFTQDT